MIGVRDIGKAGFLALLLTAGTAAADPFSEPEKVEGAVSVSYAEFDLTKPAGASALYERLQRAAAEVCGLNARTVGLTGGASTAQKKACYQDSLSRAVAQVDAPLLAAEHAG